MFNSIKRLITVIPVFCLFILANVLICSTVSGTVFLELILHGVDQSVAFISAILVAVGVYFYMYYYHKIREFMYNYGADK